MGDPVTVATLAAQFGVPALLAVVIFLAYQRLSDRVLGVVQANVEAIQQMVATMNKHDERGARVEVCLADHERRESERISRLEHPITEIAQTVKRMEPKLDAVHAAVQRHP